MCELELPPGYPELRILGNEFSEARTAMAKNFDDREPGGLFHGYVANIAMKIYDDQNREEQAECLRSIDIEPTPHLDLQTVPGCNMMATQIMDLVFGLSPTHPDRVSPTTIKTKEAES
ncbi:MAG: hypothetical protein J3T61_12860 [Candidatus Brocadiales bacterium]|nr:hypothetical protein [Candidatus Bathyanammoxibius sp.]